MENSLVEVSNVGRSLDEHRLHVAEEDRNVRRQELLRKELTDHQLG